MSENPKSSEDGKPTTKRRFSMFNPFRRTKDKGRGTSSQKAKRKRSSIVEEMIKLEKELAFDSMQPLAPDAEEDEDDREAKSETKSHVQYLTSQMAAIFIVAATTGAALRSLPYSLKESSWFGVFLIILFGVNTVYAGVCMGWSWVIMEEKWEKYQGECRVPYQELAQNAVGTWMKWIVVIAIDLSLLGTCAVYIIIIADSIETVAYEHINFCITLIIISCILMPFMWFGSYKNIKFIGIFDVVSSFLYIVFLIISFFLDKPDHAVVGSITYSDPSPKSVSLAFAGFSFAFGGGPIYPSIMTDMKDRSMFPQASASAFLIVLVLYAALSILGYAAYGDDTPQNIVQYILMNEKLFYIGLVIEIINILQLMSTFVIVLLPVIHSFEDMLDFPRGFGARRVFIRVVVVVFIMFLSLGIPYLPKFMNFVGATILNLLTFVLPPVFYVHLVYKRDSQFSKKVVNKKEWILVIEMIVLGVVIAIVSTYVAVERYINSPENRVSCYFNLSSSIPKEWLP